MPHEDSGMSNEYMLHEDPPILATHPFSNSALPPTTLSLADHVTMPHLMC